MSEINLDRVIVATAISGEKFVGTIPKGQDLEAFAKECDNSGSMTLEEVRHLAVQLQPNTNQAGQVVGIQKLMTLVPVDVLDGPMERMRLRYATWFAVAEISHNAKHKIQSLLVRAEKQELVSRAHASGIEMAGPGSMPPETKA